MASDFAVTSIAVTVLLAHTKLPSFFIRIFIFRGNLYSYILFRLRNEGKRSTEGVQVQRPGSMPPGVPNEPARQIIIRTEAQTTYNNSKQQTNKKPQRQNNTYIVFESDIPTVL